MSKDSTTPSGATGGGATGGGATGGGATGGGATRAGAMGGCAGWPVGAEEAFARAARMARPAPDRLHEAKRMADAARDQAEVLMRSLSAHSEIGAQAFSERSKALSQKSAAVFQSFQSAPSPEALIDAWTAYATDFHQRLMLTLDAFRARGDQFLAHEAAGAPPVLIYDYEVVMDGADLDRPCCYMLLRILPPEGVEVLDWKRPYVIIDPRAGHGPGIGGFKKDSQVGVALRDGHPVYFVAFRPDPAPGQTLADVTNAEAEFVREVQRRHPDSAKPIVVGNCQGGWATLLLAASHADLTGPVVVNGAPVSYWAGDVGGPSMRYNAGLIGAEALTLLTSDLGGGQFDGANLVMNFEALNPGRTWFRKYYDIFADIDQGRERFLEFEKWWGGFYLMNVEEIQWIVQQLFVGNRLPRNEARLEHGRQVDLKQIRSPLIVFASYGDTITPPAQALNWIAQTYADEHEIKIRGQRILYMIHEEVGHLGIFVSSSVAKKEHAEMASTLKTIEALAPGLYEMRIEKIVHRGEDAHFTVSFKERTVEDVRAIGGAGASQDAAFAAVARASELQAEIYDATLRPAIQAAATPEFGRMMRDLHPLRLQRAAMASTNPLMTPVEGWAAQAAANRAPADSENPFLKLERLSADMIEASWDVFRDARAAWWEAAFFSIYSAPAATWFGRSRAFERTKKTPTALRALPEVQQALLGLERGGYAEAVIRMMILLAESRGAVRRDRLERSARLLTTTEPFESLGAATRAQVIHEQTVIVEFEPEAALAALPRLLIDPADRERAMTTVMDVAGAVEEMAPESVQTLQRMRAALGLPQLELTAAPRASAEAPTADASAGADAPAKIEAAE